MGLRKPTELRRVTLSSEGARVIVEADSGPRRVKLLTPASPEVYFALDKTPFDVGGDDAFRMAFVPGDVVLPLELAPGQTIIGLAKHGLAEVTVVVEYPEA